MSEGVAVDTSGVCLYSNMDFVFNVSSALVGSTAAEIQIGVRPEQFGRRTAGKGRTRVEEH